MPNMVRTRGVCFLILSILLSSGYVLGVSNHNAYSQENVNENTLESIAGGGSYRSVFHTNIS